MNRIPGERVKCDVTGALRVGDEVLVGLLTVRRESAFGVSVRLAGRIVLWADLGTEGGRCLVHTDGSVYPEFWSRKPAGVLPLVRIGQGDTARDYDG